MTKRTHPRDVTCRYCYARPGQKCQYRAGGITWRYHNIRRADALALGVSPGRREYERCVQRTPNYHDGAPRKTWDELPELAKWSWAKIEESEQRQQFRGSTE